MAIRLLVFAPNIKESTIAELEIAIGTRTGSAVSVSGNYGSEKRYATAWIDGLQELFAGNDFDHYWAVIRVSLEGSLAIAGNRIVEKVAGLSAEWAIKHRRKDRKVKIMICEPDGTLVTEVDA